MKILALENSTAQGSIALLADEEETIVLNYRNDRRNSAAFFQSLETLSRHFPDLDSIVVGLGPGSYAGVRIAIAAGIGLRSTAHAKILGLPSICAIDPAPNEYCVIGDARRNSFYFARICGNHLVEEIQLFDEAKFQEHLKDQAEKIPVYSSEKLFQFPSVIVRYPAALTLARLVQRGVVSAQEKSLEPIYLREPHITIPNDKRNLPILG